MLLEKSAIFSHIYGCPKGPKYEVLISFYWFSSSFSHGGMTTKNFSI